MIYMKKKIIKDNDNIILNDFTEHFKKYDLFFIDIYTSIYYHINIEYKYKRYFYIYKIIL